MSTIVTRAGKGSALTWTEGDANFTNLNTDKYQSGDSPTFVTINGTTLNLSGSAVFLGATYYQAAASVASGDWRIRQSAGVFYQDYYNGSSWVNLVSYASFGVGITNTLNVGVTLTVAGSGGLTLTDGQIKFPAVQVPSSNANTLDDYEEGTFSLTDASGGGLSITSSGRYVKIGRMVHIECSAEYPVTGDVNNTLLTGLPFTTSAAPQGGFAIGLKTVSTLSTVLWGLSGVDLSFRNDTGGNLTNADMSAQSVFFSGTYMASA